MHRSAWLLAASLLLLASACVATETGANGLVEFTPRDCGRLKACDFQDGIGAGGRISVQIAGIDGFSTAGLNLESADPSIFTVEAVSDIDDAPAWDLVTTSPGSADLLVVDPGTGEELDSLEIDILPVDAISSFNADENEPRRATTVTTDEGWLLTQNEDEEFQIEALSDGQRTMGRFVYVIDLDDVILQNLNDPNPESGHLAFKAPSSPEAFYASFDNQLGQQLAIVFQAAPGD